MSWPTALPVWARPPGLVVVAVAGWVVVSVVEALLGAVDVEAVVVAVVGAVVLGVGVALVGAVVVHVGFGVCDDEVLAVDGAVLVVLVLDDAGLEGVWYPLLL